MKTLRIGSGAGYSGDRIDPAVELAEKGQLHYLAFECLAERTIAIAQQARLANPEAGFDPLLIARWEAVLPACIRNKVKVLTNMGAANPEAAVRATLGVLKKLGIKGVKVAAVLGDDVLRVVESGAYEAMETGTPLSALGTLVSANAYLGAAPLVAALEGGADIVITGRVADPALFMAPLIHEFGWKMDDWHLLGIGTMVGHLLECGAQVCGGYYAEPGKKDVPQPHRIGFPIAEVSEQGDVVITKVSGSGGLVSVATCTEQLLYEIHDPAAYFTPDVVADFSQVRFVQEGPDRVRATGATGKARTATLKASIGYVDSYIGEGQISYAGPGARARGQLALDICKERMPLLGLQAYEARYDLIGVNALHGNTISHGEPYEVRARVAVRTPTMAEAVLVGNDVEALYTNGPAGGAGAFKSARQVIAMVSTLIPRDLVKPSVVFSEEENI